jgi:hypothetical protein
VFAIFDQLLQVPGYQSLCNLTQVDVFDTDTCEIVGFPRFWEWDAVAFDQDEDYLATLALPAYPGALALPVTRSDIMGRPLAGVRTANGTVVTGSSAATNHAASGDVPIIVPAEGFRILFLNQDNEQAMAWEVAAVEKILAINAELVASGSDLQVEVLAAISFQKEFLRAILNDMPLSPWCLL